MEQRIWKPLLGYKDYVVSNFGEIVNRKTKKALLGYLNNGYRRVKIIYKGRSVDINVARAVWEAFNGPIPYGYEIYHWDTDRTNNCLSNLRCVTHLENMRNPNTRINMHKSRKRNNYRYEEVQ